MTAIKQPYLVYAILNWLAYLEETTEIHEVWITEQSEKGVYILEVRKALLENKIDKVEYDSLMGEIESWNVLTGNENFETHNGINRVLIGYIDENLFDEYFNSKVSGDKLDVFLHSISF